MEHVDRIEIVFALNRPPLCLVALNQCNKHIELVALLAALNSAPARVDLRKRCAVILVGANGPDFHQRAFQYRDTVRASMVSYWAWVPINFTATAVLIDELDAGVQGAADHVESYAACSGLEQAGRMLDFLLASR